MRNIRASLATALIMGMGSMLPIMERGLPAPTIQGQPRRTKGK